MPTSGEPQAHDEPTSPLPHSEPRHPGTSALRQYGEGPPYARFGERLGGKGRLVKRLEALHLREHDTLIAYRQAHRRLRDPVSREQMRRFIGDRHLHMRQLEHCLRALGGRPSRRASVRSAWTRAKVAIGSLLSDNGTMRALRAQSEQLTDAYNDLLVHEDVPVQVRGVLAEAVRDQDRHREWIVDRAGHV